MSSIERAIDRLGELIPGVPVPPVAQPTPPAAPARVEQLSASEAKAGNRVLRNGRVILKFDPSERRLHVSVDPVGVEANITDEYRHIKRPLLANAFGAQAATLRNSRILAVTSSVPGEGKSFTALNLAICMAMERDKGVLLIDGDSAKLSLSRQAGLDKEPGLVDVLAHPELDLQSVIIPTDVPRFTFLPAGRRHGHTAELLTSQRMAAVLAELSERYQDRVIIFDSPPLLATPEAQLVCAAAGQIVFVIEAEKTPRATVEQALELISEDDNRPVGLVLNKHHSYPGMRYHGGYYGYYG